MRVGGQSEPGEVDVDTGCTAGQGCAQIPPAHRLDLAIGPEIAARQGVAGEQGTVFGALRGAQQESCIADESQGAAGHLPALLGKFTDGRPARALPRLKQAAGQFPLPPEPVVDHNDLVAAPQGGQSHGHGSPTGED
ncbi:hypothetical protein GCM10019016_103900 [Streptomyces prasinosporus]|uniref:Uncharacterized protein n=1 Tax=Streptomyces prasinosporus TaxID=68256 RepID=A0ABP6U7Y2_9ACTN